MSFLNDVLEVKRREVEALKVMPSRSSGSARPGFSNALSTPGLSVIAEIKRASPSKGLLAPDLDVARTVRAYEAGGASAISCLTDRTFFGARADDFSFAVSGALPVLRKDFIIDETQLDESAAMGASAALLIVRILSPQRLHTLQAHARMLGLETLVEVHDEKELEQALLTGASVVGVNNRDLETLAVDPGRALRLRAHIPKGVLAVAESGVRNREDVTRIEDAGFDAVLIGETLAVSPDPGTTLRELLGQTTGVPR